ncbi:M1 family metallopeptidase [Thermomonas paludicola]|uniref:M1 family metallopeptidase n=1 Tax=Thermomonas paludicola TaxID=2884874 RepID=UPI002113B369|nr:M1 family metallopeptidase [Thermomonas paludicola]
MRRLLTSAIALALASGSFAAAAEQATPGSIPQELTTSQLPRTVRPSHYAIEVTPHAQAMSFDGKLKVDVDVLQSTDRIVLQAIDMTFANSTLTSAAGTVLPASVSVDAGAQTATFVFDKALAPGKYVLSTGYTGKIGTQANGLFALDYPTESGKQRALYTQFENSDARRFIPSWDEPNYKATFDLAVNAPAGQMVVSNMPAKDIRDIGGGLQRVTFATTPKMSTYLLFLGVGEFDRATLKADDGVEVGVIAAKGKVAQAQFALEASRDILREYNDYFGVRYPLPKLDNIAAPGRSQFFSAMENWGAIFTFEYSLLLDPATSSNNDKQGVFTTAAHEIAHQWFGDLVTMRWWDDLWLNEGFATWMEGRTTRKLHPEWDANGVDAAFTSRGAMGGDGYATTHPIVQHLTTVEQASQAFDGITYGKGSAVISMLEDYVGESAWRNGVRSYIKRHAYGNAVTDELWEEMEKAAPGKQFLQVAHDFTLQPGVPLIKASSVCTGGNTVLSLVQDEYTVDRPGKTPLRWRVPVSARAGQGAIVRTLVDGKASLTLPGCDAPVLVNVGQKGYYRTLYAPVQFKALSAGFAKLPVVDQMGVMLDASALSAVGLQPESDTLDLAMQVPLSAAPELWQMVAGSLGGIDDMLKEDVKRQAAFRTFAIAKLSPKFEQLGWSNRKEDSVATRQLRASMISMLGSLGDAKVLAEATRRFDASASDPGALPPDLRRTVLGMVARNADAATWDRLHAMAKAEKSAMLRDQYYGLLSRAKDAMLAQRALDMALTDEPGATNSAGMIAGVSWEHPELAFDFAVAHREQVDKLVDSTSRARYYPGLGSSSNKLAMADKITAFSSQYIAATSRRDAERVVNGIQTRVKLRAQRMPQIDAWLKQHGI